MDRKILICDDQPIIHKTLGVYLREEGYEAISAFNGKEAIEKFESQNPTLIILDIMMPVMSGIEVCREIRQQSRVPIIMLTAKGEEIDRVLGLELGADDYIVKPFSIREVIARIKSVLRRYLSQADEPPKALKLGGLEVDLANYSVKINGDAVRFTPKEVEILEMLASHPGKVFSREQILSRIWGYDYFGDTRAVDTQIKRIRQKFPHGGLGFAINTVYGIGYKFELTE